MDDTLLISFKAICSFIKDLNEEFGKRQKSLALYSRLIEKTGIMHETPIKKHLEAFKSFCMYNREAIAKQDRHSILEPKIMYSERVYIDMNHIFSMAEKDKETTEIIWKHILTISAILDPSNNAKKILQEHIDKSKSKGSECKEEEFISSLIDKVEKSIDPSQVSDNPMQAISQMMSSGVITDLIGNMQSGLSSGDLDLNKLMGTVQGMMSKVGGGNDTGMPDLGGMMNMFGGMMGGGNIPNVSEVDEDEKN